MGLIKPAVLPVGQEHLELCNRQLHKLTHFASLARKLPRDEPMPAPTQPSGKPRPSGRCGVGCRTTTRATGKWRLVFYIPLL
jgi:hypothetical protein